MKNKLTDLNDHLFAELERLSDEDLKGDALIEEIGRSKAVTDVAKAIVDNATLVFNAHKHSIEFRGSSIPMIGLKNDDQK